MTCQRMVTTECVLRLLRITRRFQPLLGAGASAMANSLVSISIMTGTPGRAPFSVPVRAEAPLISSDPLLSRYPDQLMTPDDGPVYPIGGGFGSGGFGSGGFGSGGFGSGTGTGTGTGDGSGGFGTGTGGGTGTGTGGLG